MSRCLDCKFWMRNADPIIGKCEKFGDWTFQFERCPAFVFEESRHAHFENKATGDRERKAAQEYRDQQKNAEIERLVREGRTANEIKCIVGAHYYRVHAVARDAGLTVAKKQREYSNVPPEIGAQILEWRNAGQSYYSIASKVGYSQHVVSHYCKVYGAQQ